MPGAVLVLSTPRSAPFWTTERLGQLPAGLGWDEGMSSQISLSQQPGLPQSQAAPPSTPLLWLGSSHCHVAFPTPASCSGPRFASWSPSFFSSGNIWKLSEKH